MLGTTARGMITKFQYDVFLSHNSTDKPRVQPPAKRLRLDVRKHLKVWLVPPKLPSVGRFDEWVIQPGDDIDLAIERGLEASRTLACPTEAAPRNCIHRTRARQRRRMLCLSPAALGSDCVGLERSTIGTGNLPFRDPANAGRSFIPLLRADCNQLRRPKTTFRVAQI